MTTAGPPPPRRFAPALSPVQLAHLRGLYENPDLTIKQAGDHFGISEATVRKYAKNFGWTRKPKPGPPAANAAPGAVIATAADADRKTVAAVAVAGQAAAIRADVQAAQGENLPQMTSAQMVAAAADVMAVVLQDHKSRLKALKDHAGQLFDELRGMAKLDPEAINAAFTALASQNPLEAASTFGKIFEALAVEKRVKILRMVVSMSGQIIDWERTAYGLGGAQDNDGTLEDYLAGLTEPPAAP